MNKNQHYISGAIALYVKTGVLNPEEIKQKVAELISEEGLENEISAQWVADIIEIELSEKQGRFQVAPKVVPQFKKFSEITALVPEASWAYWRNEINKGEFIEETCLFIDGDWEIENLNLDQVKDDQDNSVFLILVTGNIKAGNIFCENRDGSTGLITLGTLKADNMLVGGQQIYICGNLKVKGCFWGDYNHGDLVVNGSITAPVFISSDYGFNFKRFQEKDNVFVDYFLWDEQDDTFPQAHIAMLFRDKYVVGEFELDDDIYGWADWLHRPLMIDELKTGGLLLRNIRSETPISKAVPFLFESEEFNGVNFKRLRESVLFTDNLPPDEKGVPQNQRIEYWRGDIFKRVLVIKETALSETLYFQKDDEYAVFVNYEKVQQGLIDKLLAKESKYEWTFSCKELKGDDQEWHVYHPHAAPKKFLTLMETCWKALLYEFSEMEYYQQQYKETITTSCINEILSLKLVKDNYSDYFNENEQALWFRDFAWTFRQAVNEKQACPRITIIHELSAEEPKQHDFYNFDLDTQENGTLLPVLYTQHKDGYESDVYKVPVTDTEKFKKALYYFKMMRIRTTAENKHYLAELQAIKEKRDKLIAETPRTVPVETLNFGGYNFKVITVHRANDLLKDIKDIEEKKNLYEVYDDVMNFSNFDKNGYFLLAETDVILPHLQLLTQQEAVEDFSILGFIFERNLTLTSYLMAHDTNYSPALIVMGNLSCKNINLFGNRFYIQGDVICQFLHVAYNHGSLFVKGRIVADCIFSDDMVCHFGEIVAGAIISDYCVFGLDTILDEQNQIQKVLNFYPNTHQIADVLVAEVINEDYFDPELPVMDQLIFEGKSVVDVSKDVNYKQLTDAAVGERFDAIFKNELLAGGTYSFENYEHQYTFNCFDWQGKPYREVSYRNDWFSYVLRIVHAVEENAYTAYLEYQEEETRKVKLRFSSRLSDTFTSTKAVKCAFLRTEEALNEAYRIANEPRSLFDELVEHFESGDLELTEPLAAKLAAHLELPENEQLVNFETTERAVKRKKSDNEELTNRSLFDDLADQFEHMNKTGELDFPESLLAKLSTHLEADEEQTESGAEPVDEETITPVIIQNDSSKLVFHDFNFKLAVIQILMYEKELLLPKFDLHEFVKNHKERNIDLEQEGYEFIPEVKAYFEQLEIDQSLADQVNEIYQDGADDIYFQMMHFWDGETEDFNIQEFKDITQFKNLKQMTLFYDVDARELAYLFMKGVKVDYV